jgi:hypothetical protein
MPFPFFRRPKPSPQPVEGPYRTPGERPEEPPDPPEPKRAWSLKWLALPAVLVPVALVLASRHEDPVPLVLTGEPDAAADATPSASVAVADTAPPPCPESEYKARLAAGRAALGKRKLDVARDELAAALACRPDDPEALADRGLAWLLSKELANANEDLALASRKAKAPGLLGTIWYRRGLVDEEELGGEGAKPAFATAFVLGRHEGAKKKLDGAEPCGAEIGRYEKTNLKYGDHVAHTAATLRDLVPTLEGFEEGSDVAASAPNAPEVLRLGGGGAPATSDWLVAKGTTAAWGFELGIVYRTYHCTGDQAFELANDAPGFVHATGHMAVPLVRDLNTEGSVMHGCFAGAVTGVDAYFEPKREVGLVVRRALPGRFDERAEVPGPKVTVSKKGVSVKGMGCDLFEPWDDSVTDGGAESGAGDASPSEPRDATVDAP